MSLYQSLVAVEPLTLIGTIGNLFIQMYIFKRFFLKKVLDILDQRQKAADQQILDAQSAKAEAMTIKATYEQNMLQAKSQAESILENAQRAAGERSEGIIRSAQDQASQIMNKASAEIALEKEKAVLEAKNEISDLAMAIAGKVVERELTSADHAQLIDSFIGKLGE